MREPTDTTTMTAGDRDGAKEEKDDATKGVRAGVEG